MTTPPPDAKEMTIERAREMVASLKNAPAGSSFNAIHMAEFDKARGYLMRVAQENAELNDLREKNLYLSNRIDELKDELRGIVDHDCSKGLLK